MTQAVLDWSLVQSFLAVAEAGSLSAAARSTGISQPTLGRHVRTLENRLGVSLFSRSVAGLTPTDAAAELLPVAEAMRAAARRLSLAAAGREERLSGTVRITASRIVSHHLLPPVLVGLRQAEPAIEIELVPSDTTENLLFREADIAVRMYRPDQLDVVTRHVTDLPLGLYAAHTYLDRRGRPADMAALMRLDFVGYDRSDLIIRLMRGLGLNVGRDFFPVRCDDQLVHWNLVRAGCGVGGMQRTIGDADPLVERIGDFAPLPPIPVWLTAHPALRRTPRIRRVWDFLADALAAAVPA